MILLLLLLVPELAAAQERNPSFNLINRSGRAINEVYATPPEVDGWGRDRLDRSYVPPGQIFPVRLPADGNCVYDIKVVYADGRPEERRRVDTCQTDAIAFPGGRGDAGRGDAGRGDTGRGDAGRGDAGRDRAGGQTSDPSFRLVNRGRVEVQGVYVSEVGDENWGRNRLDDDTVSSGDTRVIRLPNGACIYDLRVVFANGRSMERRRVDLCKITDLRVP